MANRKLLRPRARADLKEIWWYIAEDSPARADAMLDRIDEALRLLADYPEMGRVRDEIEAGLRSFSVGQYVVFYRALPQQAGIDVGRILSARQDIGREFGLPER